MARAKHILCAVALLLATAAAPSRGAELSKGHRLLIEHGFQIQGMATKDDVFHLQTYQAANYTAINWLWDANVSHHGAAPGFAWARWVGDASQMPPRAGGGEEPFMPRLV